MIYFTKKKKKKKKSTKFKNPKIKLKFDLPLYTSIKLTTDLYIS